MHFREVWAKNVGGNRHKIQFSLCVNVAGETRYLVVRPQPVYIAGGFFLVRALVAALLSAIRRATTELAVTDHRVIFKRGLVSRYTIEMARSKVESVDVQQSIGGRIFNYGTILVRGTGGSLEPFPNIEDPLRLRSAITAA